jgi:hypothetical protein
LGLAGSATLRSMIVNFGLKKLGHMLSSAAEVKFSVMKVSDMQ